MKFKLLSRNSLALCLLLVVATSEALALCPLRISNPENRVTLIESNYAKFKIEDQWIKQMYPSPLGDAPWKYSSLESGAAQIEGVFNQSQQSQTFSNFFAVRKGAQTYWYVIVKERLGWVVASQVGDQFVCKYVNNPSEFMAATDRVFKKLNASKSVLEVEDPYTLYSRIGLN